MNKKVIKIIIAVLGITIIFILSLFWNNRSTLANSNKKTTLDYNKTKQELVSLTPISSSTPLVRINDLNKTPKILDSNASDTDTSTLEYNYRENVVLTDEIAITGMTDDNITVKDSTPYFSYPRLFTLNNPIKSNNSNYKYIMVYESTQNKLYLKYEKENGNEGVIKNLNDNGIDIYYTLSNDLKNWTNPSIVFQHEPESKSPRKLLYLNYSNEILEYKDSSGNYKLMALTCRYAFGHYGFVSAEPFNHTGIYVKDWDNKNNQWGSERKIFTGYCYDASAIQLDSGEIQVYMTQVAPSMYYQASSGEHAHFSAYHNSSSVGMISSLDGGNTWTPNITGTTINNTDYCGNSSNCNPYQNYYEDYTNKRNPYSAYRVAQEWWMKKQDRDSKTYGTFDFPNGKNPYTNIPGTIFGIVTSDGLHEQTVNGMASPLELNNKNKIVLPMEAGSSFVESGNNLASQADSISLAWSNKVNVKAGDKTIKKYWIDIKLGNSTTYNKEKDVYNSEGLYMKQMGPINRASHLLERGSGPDLVQFPSGETVLSYHFWPNMRLKLGNANAEFGRVYATGEGTVDTRKIEEACGEYNQSEDTNHIFGYSRTEDPQNNKMVNGDTICVEGNSYWGALSVVDSHKVILTKAFKADNEEKYTLSDNFVQGAISLSSYYLNHTLDIKNEDFSDTNNDALFIGSDSQAQASIRANYDGNNIYLYADVLDENVTSSDGIKFYINSSNLKHKNYNYNYLYFKIDKVSTVDGKKINFSLVRDDIVFAQNASLSNITADINVNNTGDDNGGYKIIVTIPREEFNLIDDKIKLNVVLNNCDNSTCTADNTISDIIAGTSKDKLSTWINVNLLKSASAKLSSSSKYTENNSFLKNIGGNTKISTYKNNFELSGDTSTIQFNIRSLDENSLSNNDKISTGSKTQIISQKEILLEYTNIVNGDVTGDGDVTLADLMKMATHILKDDNLIKGEAFMKAADVTNDGSLKLSDVMKLAGHILKGDSLF